MLIGSFFFAVMALLAESLAGQFTYPWITFVRSGVATVLALFLAIAGGADQHVSLVGRNLILAYAWQDSSKANLVSIRGELLRCLACVFQRNRDQSQGG